MEQIKKKMCVLRETLSEAEQRADKAENDLKEANERAENVSKFIFVIPATTFSVDSRPMFFLTEFAVS